MTDERELYRCNLSDRILVVRASFSGYEPLMLEFISCDINSEDYRRLSRDHLLSYLRFRGHNLVFLAR